MLRKVIFVAVFLLGLQSCSKAPPCTYEGKDVEGKDVVKANAGCMVVHDKKLLLVEELNGKLTLPGGSKELGEVAQCTAEREVWEETGFAVSAQNLVVKMPNGFHIYDCTLVAVETLDGSERPLRREIVAVHWVSEEGFEDKNKKWRFPEQLDLMRDWLKAKKQSSR